MAQYPFQSTPPARGATRRYDDNRQGRRDFNPRPPRGGRPQAASAACCNWIFQSTPPTRGATPSRQRRLLQLDISIHAPHEGGDGAVGFNGAHGVSISIHAPREGGDCRPSAQTQAEKPFQSTPPARGATVGFVSDDALNIFQSTPPARGGDGARMDRLTDIKNFNPRPPRGGATAKMHSFTCGSLTNK